MSSSARFVLSVTSAGCADFYGQRGENCLPCPIGGVCYGGVFPPFADFGWWQVQMCGSCVECMADAC